jgi:hypothetical protein
VGEMGCSPHGRRRCAFLLNLGAHCFAPGGAVIGFEQEAAEGTEKGGE